MLSMQPQLRPRAGGVGPRPTGSTARLCFARCSPTRRGEPAGLLNGSGASTPEDEDRRRICRERKVLIMERVQHVNRIKGLLFSQGASGYEPLRRDRRARLDALQTGEDVAVACPHISKPRFVENSIGSNCCSSRSRLWRPSRRRAARRAEQTKAVGPRRRCCWVSMALGRNSLRSSGLRNSPDTSITADRSPPMPVLPRRLGKAGQ